MSVPIAPGDIEFPPSAIFGLSFCVTKHRLFTLTLNRLSCCFRCLTAVEFQGPRHIC